MLTKPFRRGSGDLAQAELEIIKISDKIFVNIQTFEHSAANLPRIKRDEFDEKGLGDNFKLFYKIDQKGMGESD